MGTSALPPSFCPASPNESEPEHAERKLGGRAEALAPQMHWTRCMCLLLVAWPVMGTIVDRIAISVGTQVITDSELNQRIRLSAFENGAPPSFDSPARKTAADRLIDQKLIAREMDLGQYPRLGADRREKLKAESAAMEKELAKYGLTPADLETDQARQLDLLTFIDIRFRPAVQVSDQDIAGYFQTSIKPKLPKDSTAGIEDFRSRIETELTSQRADRDLDAWLKEQRKRTKIRYLEPELAP